MNLLINGRIDSDRFLPYDSAPTGGVLFFVMDDVGAIDIGKIDDHGLSTEFGIIDYPVLWAPISLITYDNQPR